MSFVLAQTMKTGAPMPMSRCWHRRRYVTVSLAAKWEQECLFSSRCVQLNALLRRLVARKLRVAHSSVGAFHATSSTRTDRIPRGQMSSALTVETHDSPCFELSDLGLPSPNSLLSGGA
jgi:hypothetical protein